eukprot:357270-Chlamydomonas_euryale.AAC.15
MHSEAHHLSWPASLHGWFIVAVDANMGMSANLPSGQQNPSCSGKMKHARDCHIGATTLFQLFFCNTKPGAFLEHLKASAWTAAQILSPARSPMGHDPPRRPASSRA